MTSIHAAACWGVSSFSRFTVASMLPSASKNWSRPTSTIHIAIRLPVR